MLQYLLNTTAIWLISLVLFDVFLRRESYHGYNRCYLLFTFLIGIFLPLWQWQDTGTRFSATLEHPVQQVLIAKQNIVAATTPSVSITLTQWLAGIYLLGVLVALSLLTVDIFKLIAVYKTGNKTRQGNWRVIETGKNHAPFSFMKMLFVSNKKMYSSGEWNIILVHEQRHTSLLHFADLLLMQLARVAFWFHPLAYVYNKRLLLVHEYQADRVSAQQPQEYGRFLIEQAVLQTAPVITHSFNRSPIKNRIVMLTRRSSAASRVKMLVFIPLALVCVICFSKNSFSQKFERKGNMVTYRGNTFEYYQDPRVDTQIITDPVTNQQITRYIKFDPVPVKMNGTRIYGNNQTGSLTSSPEPYAKNGSVEDYLFRNLAKTLDRLPDGIYRIELNNVVVDTKGKIVYYEYGGITNANKNTPADIEKALPEEIDHLLNNVPAMKPGKMQNNNVISTSDIFLREYKIEVKDHKSTVSKSWK
jgi:hypothetical protein